MNATSRFLPSASSPLCVAGPSASSSPDSTWSPSKTSVFWLIEVSWLERRNLFEAVGLAAEVAAGLGVVDRDAVPAHLGDGARGLGEDHVARVARRAALDAGAHVGRLGDDERHGLLLHVRAHERAVGVVVLDERDERRRDRDDLLRANVHQLDLGRRHVVHLEVVPNEVLAAPTRMPVPCGPRRTSTRSTAIFPSASTGVFACAMT